MEISRPTKLSSVTSFVSGTDNRQRIHKRWSLLSVQKIEEVTGQQIIVQKQIYSRNREKKMKVRYSYFYMFLSMLL